MTIYVQTTTSKIKIALYKNKHAASYRVPQGIQLAACNTTG
jgi:hypothetical protein